MNVSSSIQILSEVCAFLLSPTPSTLDVWANAPLYSGIGLSDGLTVPSALTAGLSSLGDSKIVILGGIAELIAGAISIGIGGSWHLKLNGITTATCVKRRCDGGIQCEVVQVLGPVGVDEKICSSVAKRLLNLELESEGHV